MNFQERIKRGYTGENLVLEYLTNNGFIVYINGKEQRHPVDMICFDKNNYSRGFFAEVKTKPKLSNYNGTGFDLKHLMIYKRLQREYNMNVFIYFVDFSLRRIYGNYIDELLKPTTQVEDDRLIEYPFEMGRYSDKIVIFGLNSMISIATINNHNNYQITPLNNALQGV